MQHSFVWTLGDAIFVVVVIFLIMLAFGCWVTGGITAWWTTLRCKHEWDCGRLVDFGRTKMFCCTKPGCRGTKIL